MGDVGHIDYVCETCKAHHYTCVWCNQITTGDEGEELCARCFHDFIPLHGVISMIEYVLPKTENRDLLVEQFRKMTRHRS